MTSNTPSARVLFSLAHREARNMRRLEAAKLRKPSSAHDLSEDVARNMIEFDDLPYQRVLPVTDALLWVLHWKFMEPQRECKLWQSERRYSWNLDGQGTVKLEPPRLP